MKQQPEPIDLYVESNFVVELALSQEQHESCERLIELAGTDKVNLIVPAYSLVEPYEKIGRQASDRLKVSKALEAEAKHLSRSTSYHDEIDAMQHVTGLLVRSSAEEKEGLRSAIDRIRAIAKSFRWTLRSLIAPANINSNILSLLKMRSFMLLYSVISALQPPLSSAF